MLTRDSLARIAHQHNLGVLDLPDFPAVVVTLKQVLRDFLGDG